MKSASRRWPLPAKWLLPVLELLLLAAPLAVLNAQAPAKIFVASFGGDPNDGSRGAPKRTFQAAHDAVAAGGQIVVLDTAGYGTLNITKSISLTVPPGVNGFVTAIGSASGITINAGTTDSVTLRGLIVEGGGIAAGGIGLSITTVGNLAIEDCTVRNFERGIDVFSSTPVKCYLRHCVARGCRIGFDLETNTSTTAHSGIAIGCRFEQNQDFGVIAAVFGGNGSVDLTLTDCVVAGTAGSAGAVGVSSQGSNAVVVRVENCRIAGNAFGVDAPAGGQLFSRGNNTLENNANGNTFPGSYSAK